MPLESTFSYSNSPAAILPRKKYRGGGGGGEEEEGNNSFTLMCDPRVVRGPASRKNNHRATPGRTRSSGTRREEEEQQQQQQEDSERSLRPTYHYQVNQVVRPEIDLSQFLVEQEQEPATGQQQGRGRQPKVAQTQTDEFEPRPDTPEQVPRKTGVDVQTQVEDVSELFVWDDEVEPLLAVLCAKTLEQALLEVQREAELQSLARECDRCEQQRVGEQQWQTSREQETLAGSCTKDLALAALQSQAGRQREVRGKVAGLQAMRQVLPAMVEDICGELLGSGQWRDPQEQDLDQLYLPALYHSAASRLRAYNDSQALMDEILLLAFEGKEQAADRMELPRQRGVIKLMATGACAGLDTNEHVTLGFVAIDESDTVLSVNRKVNAKIVDEGLRLGKRVDLHGFLCTALGLSSPDDLSASEPLDSSKLPEILNIVLPDITTDPVAS